MPFSRVRAIGELIAHLNRQERQERKDIAMGLLRIANKGIFFALFAIFAVQKGGRGLFQLVYSSVVLSVVLFDEKTGEHLNRCPPDDYSLQWANSLLLVANSYPFGLNQ
jgi:hypothetical protein